MEKPTKIAVRNLDFYYGQSKALSQISLEFKKNQVSALIGPSGCGKSTFLRCINRMNDLIPGVRVEGELLIENQNIYGSAVDVVSLRRKVGMVFQKPNPFPKTIFENVAYGMRVNGIRNRTEIRDRVEQSLRQAALFDEVKERLDQSALRLSGGQQQRLCIARALAVEPDVVLMDEPCSALDPRSTTRVEELIGELRSTYTIIIVTHNMQQAARVSDYTAFLYEGELIEYGLTRQLFVKPQKKQTEDYITGRFG